MDRRRRSSEARTWRGWGLLSLVLLAGCDGDATHTTATIEATRVASKAYIPVREGLSLKDRIGVSKEANGSASSSASAAQAPPDIIPFTYDPMPGWTALPPQSPFRHVNLRYKPDPTAELTVAAYEDRGGLAANINRWRRQVGESELSAEEIAELPRVALMGAGRGILVEAYGPYQGMRGPRIEDGGIMGAILGGDRFTLFVKFTGSRAVLTAERERFMSFLSSLAPGQMPESSSGGRVSPLTWSTPEGWVEEPPKSQFREMTFRIGAVEVSLSLARGELKDNVNRWAGQVQAAPLDDEQLAQLRRVPSMGTEAVVYEGAGPYQGMRDASPREGQRLMAAIVTVPGADGTIATLKAVGPDADVAATRDQFDALLSSLALRSR